MGSSDSVLSFGSHVSAFTSYTKSRFIPPLELQLCSDELSKDLADQTGASQLNKWQTKSQAWHVIESEHVNK